MRTSKKSFRKLSIGIIWRNFDAELIALRRWVSLKFHILIYIVTFWISFTFRVEKKTKKLLNLEFRVRRPCCDGTFEFEIKFEVGKMIICN